MHLGLGRDSPPPTSKGSFPSLSSGSTDMAAQRFPSGRMGPPPGFGGIQLDDLTVERDPHG